MNLDCLTFHLFSCFMVKVIFLSVRILRFKTQPGPAFNGWEWPVGFPAVCPRVAFFACGPGWVLKCMIQTLKSLLLLNRLHFMWSNGRYLIFLCISQRVRTNALKFTDLPATSRVCGSVLGYRGS